MAYHYVWNSYTGERKRVLTTSLPYYRDSVGTWQVFDSQEERDAICPDWYCVSYEARTISAYSPSSARQVWTAAHLKAGYALFHNRANAQAALDAMPQRWVARKVHGQVKLLPDWMRGTEEGDMRISAYLREYGEEIFPSREAALAACPRFVVIKQDGEISYCYAASVQERRDAGYWVGATLEEARAQMPVRYIFSGAARRYVRAERGDVLRHASFYARLRGAIRAAREGREWFAAEVGAYRGPREYIVRDVLTQVRSNISARLDCLYYASEDGPRIYETKMREAIARLCALFGENVLRPCPDCSGENFVILMGEMRHNPQGQAICDNCRHRYRYCMECHTCLAPDDVQEDWRGNIYCEAHWQEPDDGPRGRLLDYSTDITRRKRCFQTATGEKKSDRTLWLGWELEVHARAGEGEPIVCHECEDCVSRDEDGDPTGDCNDSDCECHAPRGTDAAKKLAICHIQDTAKAWAIAKSDSSLNDGLEIVSVPATLAWHAATVKPWLKGAGAFISGWPHDDCGMHVHVGRAQLSKLTQGKMLTFMQDPANQDFITAIAGRDNNTYCVRGVKKKIPDYALEDSRGRYQALNFATRGKKTLEFRIFRSNVSPAGFMKNLEFCHAVCSWARVASMQDVAPMQGGIRRARNSNAVQNFIAYTKRNRAEYPHLVKWLEAKGYLPKPRVHPDAPIPSLEIAA